MESVLILAKALDGYRLDPCIHIIAFGAETVLCHGLADSSFLVVADTQCEVCHALDGSRAAHVLVIRLCRVVEKYDGAVMEDLETEDDISTEARNIDRIVLLSCEEGVPCVEEDDVGLEAIRSGFEFSQRILKPLHAFCG